MASSSFVSEVGTSCSFRHVMLRTADDISTIYRSAESPAIRSKLHWVDIIAVFGVLTLPPLLSGNASEASTKLCAHCTDLGKPGEEH